jgi:hypothetical protein
MDEIQLGFPQPIGEEKGAKFLLFVTQTGLLLQRMLEKQKLMIVNCSEKQSKRYNYSNNQSNVCVIPLMLVKNLLFIAPKKPKTDCQTKKNKRGRYDTSTVLV